MKKIASDMKVRIGIILAFTVVLLCGCERFLVTDPNDKIYMDDNFTSSLDIDNAARGMYDGLQSCVEKMFVWGEVRGDLVWPARGAGWEIEELNNLNVTSMNRFAKWDEFYDVINRANYIIKYAEKVQQNDFNFTDSLKEQYVAEAINVRALAYFWLVRTFGDVPFILEPFDENYLSTKNDTLWQDGGEYDVKEMPVYYVDPTYSELILDSLEIQLARVEGIERIYSNEYSEDNSINASIYSSRFKAITNLVLQADIKLMRNKFDEVATLCDRIFAVNKDQYSLGDNSKAPVCFNSSMAPVQRWIELFTGDGSLMPSTIFEIRFQSSTPDLNVLQEYTAADSHDGGKYIVQPSLKAINYWQDDKFYNVRSQYRMDTCDIMRGFNASFSGEYDLETGEWIDPYIFKFLVNGKDGISRSAFESDCNWIMYRMADVLCMQAEAINRQGNYGKAIRKLQGTWGYSNAETYGLRNRALVEEYISEDDAPPQDPYEPEGIILEERAKEMAFEGKRWYDMIRIAQRRGQYEFFLDEVELSAPLEKKTMLRERAANPENWYLPYHEDAKKYFVNPDYQNKTIEKVKSDLGL